MIIYGDSLKELKKLDENSIDLIVTDPPYGYSFMGKDWDKAVPKVEIWQECLRVLKDGAFILVMSAPRQDVLSHMIVNLGDAGFRTDFTSLYWTYASGFPKASNIGKMVDKRLGKERKVVGKKSRDYPDSDKWGVNKNPNKNNKFLEQGGDLRKDLSDDGMKLITEPASDDAKALEGSYGGFQPKPAVEVILVAMKPCSEKTYVDQALKNGKGITWLDNCRIPYESEDKFDIRHYTKEDCFQNKKPKDSKFQVKESNTQGRFPANLLVSDDVLNDGKITVSKDGGSRGDGDAFFGNRGGYKRNAPNDSGSYSRYFDLDKWANQLPFLICPKEGRFPANLLVSDDVLNDGKITKSGYAEVGSGGKGESNFIPKSKVYSCYGDSGSYSRYFDLDKWANQLPFLICPKASKSEKNKGCDGMKEKVVSGESNEFGKMGINTPEMREKRGVTKELPKYTNHHPTVKPLKLMSYLITLGSQRGDIILDPFVGSGTTCIAAKQLGRKYIGIEREKEYVDIAEARLEAVEETLL